MGSLKLFFQIIIALLFIIPLPCYGEENSHTPSTLENDEEFVESFYSAFEKICLSQNFTESRAKVTNTPDHYVVRSTGKNDSPSQDSKMLSFIDKKMSDRWNTQITGLISEDMCELQVLMDRPVGDKCPIMRNYIWGEYDSLLNRDLVSWFEVLQQHRNVSENAAYTVMSMDKLEAFKDFYTEKRYPVLISAHDTTSDMNRMILQIKFPDKNSTLNDRYESFAFWSISPAYKDPQGEPVYALKIEHDHAWGFDSGRIAILSSDTTAILKSDADAKPQGRYVMVFSSKFSDPDNNTFDHDMTGLYDIIVHSNEDTPDKYEVLPAYEECLKNNSKNMCSPLGKYGFAIYLDDASLALLEKSTTITVRAKTKYKGNVNFTFSLKSLAEDLKKLDITNESVSKDYMLQIKKRSMKQINTEPLFFWALTGKQAPNEIINEFRGNK